MAASSIMRVLTLRQGRLGRKAFRLVTAQTRPVRRFLSTLHAVDKRQPRLGDNHVDRGMRQGKKR
jgi:hypothetical protein